MAITDNLISYWKLDESSGNPQDSVGSNNLTNNSVTYGAGKINNGAVFNSQTDYLTITNATQTGLNFTSDMSCSFWVKWVDSSQNNWFLGKSAGGTNRSYWFEYIDQGGGTFFTSFAITSTGAVGAGLAKTTYSAAPYTNGSWYHIVFTYSAANTRGIIYLNGSAVVTDNSQRAAIFNGTGDFFAGNDNDLDYNSSFTLDELGLWSRELTSGEVTTLYNSGNGIQYPFSTPSGFSIVYI